MKTIWKKQGFISDMDGVLYHGNRLLDGVKEFIGWLENTGKRYLFLTNASERAPRELAQKLNRLGLCVDEQHFYTSALATAEFLSSQCPGGSAYVIGEPGLLGALYDAGFSMNDQTPDYVVVGETRTYNYEKIERAIWLVQKGARLIGTNPDLTGPGENGTVPATRALVAPIELSTGCSCYYVGKPNPLMMRHAMKRLGTEREDTIIIGDRMDTDIVAGIETEIDTLLVLSGVTTREMLATFPYRPRIVLDDVGKIPLAYENDFERALQS